MAQAAPRSRRGHKAKSKRAYHSPLREQQSAATRRGIIAAAAELVHELPDWDWTNLNAAAVSERADVSERTVRRYFSSDDQLRDALLQHLISESGVDLETLELDNFGDNVARLVTYLQSFAADQSEVSDPAFQSLDEQRRKVLLAAVARATPDWSDADRETAAAVLDIVWQPVVIDRLRSTWNFDPARTTAAMTWVVDLIVAGVESNRPPEKG